MIKRLLKPSVEKIVVAVVFFLVFLLTRLCNLDQLVCPLGVRATNVPFTCIQACNLAGYFYGLLFGLVIPFIVCYLIAAAIIYALKEAHKKQPNA